MRIKERLNIKDPQALTDKLGDFIKNTMERYNREGCILGNSGGIDSALVAFLAVRALGKDRVEMLFLPERDSSGKSYHDALEVSDALGVPMKEISITPLLKKIGVYRLEPSPLFIPRSIQERYVANKHKKYDDEKGTTFIKTLKGGVGNPQLQRDIAYYRIKHRLRMAILYYYGEMKNYMVLGTSNRSEKMTGLFVKYGDGASDLDPIAGLYKTQVFELAEFLNVPRSIIEKAPTPDLAPGLTDEQTLNLSYDKLDIILAGLDMGMEKGDIAREAGVEISSIDYVKQLTDVSWHMRNLPLEPDNI
ncbi:MAG: NAD(+) synthase [Mahellales bacterium]